MTKPKTFKLLSRNEILAQDGDGRRDPAGDGMARPADGRGRSQVNKEDRAR